MALDEEKLKAFVIHELGSQRSRNDLIMALCRKGKMDWNEAEKFVRQVEFEHKDEIARKQMPFIMTVTIGGLITGLVLMIFIAVVSWQGVIITMSNVPYLGNVSYFTTGFLVFAGSLIGLSRQLMKK